jgi:protein phosphatase
MGMSMGEEMTLSITAVARSDQGKVRSNNEDSFLVRDDLALYVVADGMGGAAAGEVASGLFVQAAEEVFLSGIKRGEHRRALIPAAFEEAHSQIKANAQRFPGHEGMGCTAEILTFENNHYFLGHVGDSRTYHFDGKTLRQITTDHTYIQDQLNLGILTPEEAKHHRLRHILSRAVGHGKKIRVDYHSEQVTPGSVFLQCSDGLFGELSDDRITEILRDRIGLADKAEQLVETAKEAGGRDNITVVLSHVVRNNNVSGLMGIRRLWSRH